VRRLPERLVGLSLGLSRVPDCAGSCGKPIVAYTGGARAHPWTVYVSASVHAELKDAADAL